VNDWNPPQPPPSASGPDIGAALSYGWRKFQANLGPVLAVVLVPVLVQLGLSVFANTTVDSLAGMFVVQVLSFVVGAAAALGIYQTALMITAGETPDLGKAFSSDRWGEWILFSIVFGLIIGAGALLCGVGALIAVGLWGMSGFYLLDQRMGIGQALRASFTATRANMNLAVAVAVCVLVGIAGVVLCGIGYFVTAPIAYIAVAYLYRLTNGQPVAP
jgi:uncharacterized membrane protein